jgi:tetratricopeptide (TPR) repeat protein
LRKRGEEIATRIKEGKDSFAPELLDFKPLPVAASSIGREPGEPAHVRASETRRVSKLAPLTGGTPAFFSNARRTTNASQCRWTGINDLLVEQQLEATCDERACRRILPLLERVVTEVKNRRRPMSSFSILAIEWLFCGYPPDAVLRLRREIGSRVNDPSLELFDLTCRLYQTEESELAPEIEKALSQGKIPPLLAALLHQRRLLPPMSLSSALGRVRAARRFLSEAKAEMLGDKEVRTNLHRQAVHLLRNIRETSDTMTARRRAQVEDAPPVSERAVLDGESASDRLKELAQKAERINNELDGYWKKLKECGEANKKGTITEAQVKELRDIKKRVEEKSVEIRQGLADIAGIRTKSNIKEQLTLQLLDKVERAFQGINTGRFWRKLRELLEPGSLSARPETTLLDLEEAAIRLETQIEGVFEKAVSSFEDYSPLTLAQPPFRALSMSVRAQQAETMYRLGRHKTARRIWNTLLCQDRLDVNLLKNIAVCDSSSPDLGRALTSWKAYIEMLYFHDVIAGSPRPHALARSEFHRHFGSAYAPPFLFEQLQRRELSEADEEALLTFLNSPSRVRTFVDHRLLEFLNSKLNFNSPPLILGIRRSDGEKTRERVGKELQAFTQNTGSLLPERVRDAFVDIVCSHVQSASDACASAGRLTLKRDPRYPQEERQHEQWIKEVCEFKKTLLAVIQGSKELPKGLRSIDFVEQLARLDAIPITQSATFLEAVASQLGLADTSPLVKMSEYLRDNVMYNVMQFIFRESHDPTDGGLREVQYKRLINEWIKRPWLESWHERIDDPQQFYPEEVITTLRSGDPNSSAIGILRLWCQRFPELTGPPQHLAVLLYARGEITEAIAILEQAQELGFYEKGRQKCSKLLKQLKTKEAFDALEKGEFEKTLRLLLELLKTDDSNASLPLGIAGACVNLAKKNRDGSGHEPIAQAITTWVKRARERLNRHDIEEDEGTPLTEEDIIKVVNSLDDMLPQLFLAPFGDLSENSDWQGVAEAIDRLLGRYPHNISSHYWRMIAYNRLASVASQSRDLPAVRRYARLADADALIIAERSPDPEKREQAEKLRANIRDILD